LVEIICEVCGKKTNILAEEGVLCLDCWRKKRKVKREARISESLNTCFAYKSNKKFTPEEEKIVNEIMEELKAKGL
jgi:hypothetical protein